MPERHRTLAVVFDFDDTLMPDSVSQLLKSHNVDADAFWKKSRGLVEKGYDPAHAYLKLLLENIGKSKPLGKLTNNDLKSFGRRLDSKFYPGIKRLFPDLRKMAKPHNIEVRFFVVSGGLEEAISGSRIIQENFSGVYGCRLIGDGKDGTLRHIMRCITFSEKVRCLFEINKFGLNLKRTATNPYLVNENVPQRKRDIPFRNIIYVGDGLTDIPCFSVVKSFGGMSFGVFDKTEKSAKRALREFLQTDRVISMHTPKYGPKDDLGAMLRAAVAQQCGRIKLGRAEAEPEEPEVKEA